MTATTTMLHNSSNSVSEEEEKNILMLFVRADCVKSTTDKPGNIFGAADPFFEISNEQGELVARSNILYNDSTPKWAPIKLDLEALCEHNDDRNVFLSFYDHQPSGNGLIKTIVTTVAAMKQSASEYQAQARFGWSNAKPSHEFGDDSSIRVFIYDTIVTTGTPTAGTLIKTRSDIISILKPESPNSKTIATETDISTDSDENSTDDELSRIGRMISIDSSSFSNCPLSPIMAEADEASLFFENEGHCDDVVTRDTNSNPPTEYNAEVDLPLASAILHDLKKELMAFSDFCDSSLVTDDESESSMPQNDDVSLGGSIKEAVLNLTRLSLSF